MEEEYIKKGQLLYLPPQIRKHSLFSSQKELEKTGFLEINKLKNFNFKDLTVKSEDLKNTLDIRIKEGFVENFSVEKSFFEDTQISQTFNHDLKEIFILDEEVLGFLNQDFTSLNFGEFFAAVIYDLFQTVFKVNADLFIKKTNDYAIFFHKEKCDLLFESEVYKYFTFPLDNLRSYCNQKFETEIRQSYDEHSKEALIQMENFLKSNIKLYINIKSQFERKINYIKKKWMIKKRELTTAHSFSKFKELESIHLERLNNLEELLSKINNIVTELEAQQEVLLIMIKDKKTLGEYLKKYTKRVIDKTTMGLISDAEEYVKNKFN